MTGGDRFWLTHEGHISLAVALAWFAFLLGREALPPLLPTLVDSLSIGGSEAGLLMSIMWATYALSQYPGGRVSDQLTRKTVIVAGLSVATLGFLILTTMQTFGGVLLAVGMIGLGGGAFFTSNHGLLSDLFVERRGQAFGIQVAAGSLGSAGASGLAILALWVGVWQSTFLPAIVLLSVAVVILHLLVTETYAVGRVDMAVWPTAKRLLGAAEFRRLVLVYALFAFVWQGTMAFLPTFLQATKNFSPTLATLAFASLYIVGMGVGPLSGSLGDRLGQLQVAAGALVLSILGIIGMLFASRTVPVFASVLVLAVGVRAYPPTMQAFAMEWFPGDSPAGDFGALKTLYSGIGSLGPFYIGTIGEFASYRLAYVGCVAALLVSLTVTATLRGE
jgi:MFS family permease